MKSWVYFLKLLRDLLDDMIAYFEGREQLPTPQLSIDASRQSPNQSARDDVPLDPIVLHNTDGRVSGSIDHFLKSSSEVSAHYLVGRDGAVYRMVPEHRKAWHARQENSRSIGIELEAYKGAEGMTQIQERMLTLLIADIKSRHSINRIIPHRAVVNTDCPKWIWPTDESFQAWLEDNEL